MVEDPGSVRSWTRTAGLFAQAAPETECSQDTETGRRGSTQAWSLASSSEHHSLKDSTEEETPAMAVTRLAVGFLRRRSSWLKLDCHLRHD